jgi:excisionase family DNA binding protein
MARPPSVDAPETVSELTELSKFERMPMVPVPAPERWLTIREASALVGVSEATLRRWSEAGDVDVYLTPGGHRRFSTSSLAKLLPSHEHPARTLRQLGETPERIVRQYRRELASGPRAGWQARLGEDDRAAFREPGRELLRAVLDYLDAPTPEEGEASLASARTAAASYGRLAADRRLGVTETTEAYLRFRLPFLEELATVARKRRLEATQATSLVLAATSVFDRLLISLLDGRAAALAAAARSRRATRGAATAPRGGGGGAPRAAR